MKLQETINRIIEEEIINLKESDIKLPLTIDFIRDNIKSQKFNAGAANFYGTIGDIEFELDFIEPVKLFNIKGMSRAFITTTKEPLEEFVQLFNGPTSLDNAIKFINNTITKIQK